MKKQHSFGFTLIELLVVIAIIGILAALVLVALGNARDKANDARVKADIGQLRILAEIIYDSGGSEYGATGTDPSVMDCFTAATPTTLDCGDESTASSVLTLITDINKANGTGGLPTAFSSTADFCVEAALMNGTKFICADSTGITADGHTSAICLSGNMACS